METIKLNSGAKVALFPGAIVVYNFSSGDDADGKLSQILSANPGKAVLFISTKYDREIFDQAETRNRTFILSRSTIDPATVDPELPAQWISVGNMLPGLPGNLQLEASDAGFRVTSLPPDRCHTILFN